MIAIFCCMDWINCKELFLYSPYPVKKNNISEVENMIDIEEVYKDIVKITIAPYSSDRFSVVENLFSELDITVLDYEIKLKQENSFLQGFVDVVPLNLEENILDKIKSLEELEDEMDDEMSLIITILAILKI